jgi:hypothetical protein
LRHSKDPYKLDFLTLKEKAIEQDIEEQLVKHITSFLLELLKNGVRKNSHKLFFLIRKEKNYVMARY